jgi:hypothetical protein
MDEPIEDIGDLDVLYTFQLIAWSLFTFKLSDDCARMARLRIDYVAPAALLPTHDGEFGPPGFADVTSAH